MSEFGTYNQDKNEPPQIYEPNLQDSLEKGRVDYDIVEHVPESYADNPSNVILEDKFLMSGSPENTIVIVGDEIVYTGSQLTSEDVRGLTMKSSGPQKFAKYDTVNDLQVKAIKEGERTIAFATNREWAELYIAQFKKEVV